MTGLGVKKGCLKKKRAHLLTLHNRHWYALKRTLSARPVLGVLQTLSLE